MLLKTFLKKNKIKIKYFAMMAEVPVGYFYHIVQNRAPVSKELAKKIEYLTAGQVSRMEAIYPEEYKE